MNSENLEQGAFLLSRSIFNSSIWFSPPEYLKIYIYLIGRARHKTGEYKGFHLNRGQCFVNHEKLEEQLEYNIGYRKKKNTKSYTKNIIKNLKKQNLISTQKTPRGIIVTVHNYDVYQKMSNYGRGNHKSSYKKYLKSDRWRRIRGFMLEESKFCCQLCGTKNEILDVHHNNYTRVGDEQLSDLIVLCRDCHFTFHNSKD